MHSRHLLVIPLLLATPPRRCALAGADLRLDGGPSGWDAESWRVQVDGVMGGKSTGSLSFDDSTGIMAFSGEIILDGGGFSSVRKGRFAELDLTGYAGIVVTLETTRAHDGGNARPPLGVHLQFGDASSYYGFASAFAVPLSAAEGSETSVYLPLSSFDRGTRMGYQCPNCAIDFSRVNEMDVYVLFQEGRFDVRVKAIDAVDTARTYPSPSITVRSAEEVRDLIRSTIQSGVKLFNYGYAELCIAIYQSTLNTLLAAEVSDGGESPVSGVIKSMICQGLQRANTQSSSKGDFAWTLRYTLDAILEELGFKDVDDESGWRPDATTAIAESLEYRCSGVTATPNGMTLVNSSDLEILSNDEDEMANSRMVSSSRPLFCNAGIAGVLAVIFSYFVA